jgi:hypothetical protein
MPDLLRAFLSPGELDELGRLALAPRTWTPGRQGTGYDISSLREAPPPAVARALAHLGTPHEQSWDAYLIRYRDGAYVPPHLDPAQHGRRHRRLNAMITQATGGGELRIGGAPIALDPGDAVLFYPDHERHEVAPVAGTRLLFSVGAWL